MPKRFIFKLQPVLDQREREEEKAQVAVAKIERERLACELSLSQTQREFIEVRSVLRARLHPSTQPAAPADPIAAPAGMVGVRFVASASLQLTTRAQRTAMELAGILKRLDLARAELLRVTAARKAVQLLKDRAHQEHRRALLKRELAEIDELAVMRHGRARDNVFASAAADERAAP